MAGAKKKKTVQLPIHSERLAASELLPLPLPLPLHLLRGLTARPTGNRYWGGDGIAAAHASGAYPWTKCDSGTYISFFVVFSCGLHAMTLPPPPLPTTCLRHAHPYSARAGRVISTAGASANGTACGLPTRSLMHAPRSTSWVKNFCRSSSTSHASRLSMVWKEDPEISCARLASVHGCCSTYPPRTIDFPVGHSRRHGRPRCRLSTR